MHNTLVYAVKQFIPVFLISKYNIDSDFCLSYHDITTCHDIYRYIVAALKRVKEAVCKEWVLCSEYYKILTF